MIKQKLHTLLCATMMLATLATASAGELQHPNPGTISGTKSQTKALAEIDPSYMPTDGFTMFNENGRKSAKGADSSLELKRISSNRVQAAPTVPRKANKPADSNPFTWRQIGTITLDPQTSQFYGMLEWFASIFQMHNNEYTIPTDPIKVYQSITPDSDGYNTLRLSGVISDRNIDIRYIPSTGELVYEPIETGMNIADDSYTYSTFQFQSYGMWLENAKCLTLNNPWLLVGPAYGYNYGNGVKCLLDGYDEQNLSIESNRIFIPSDTPSISFAIRHTAGIKYIRNITVSGDGSISYADIGSLMQATPGNVADNIQYRDFDADDEIIFDDTDICIRHILIGFDDKMQAVTTYYAVWVYKNQPSTAQWVSLGKAKIKEMVYPELMSSETIDKLFADPVYYMMWNVPFVESEIDVEQEVGNPGHYRLKNCFGKNHPYSKHFMYQISENDNFYIYLSVDKSGNVTIEPSIMYASSAGFSYVYYLKPDTAEKHGVYADQAINIAYHAINYTDYNLDGRPYDMHIELPGYVDFSMDWSNNGLWAESTPGRFSTTMTNISTNIDHIEYALVNQRDFTSLSPDALGDMVAGASATLASPVKRASIASMGNSLRYANLEFTESQLPYGAYGVVAIGVTADNKRLGTRLSLNQIGKARPIEEWTSLGDAKIVEDMMLCPSTSPASLELMCELRENPDVRGIYAVMNFFKVWCDNAVTFGDFDGVNLYIDARDIENVILIPTPYGAPATDIHDICINGSFFNGCNKTAFMSLSEMNRLTNKPHISSGHMYFDQQQQQIISLTTCTMLSNETNGWLDTYWQNSIFNITMDYDPAKDPDNIASWILLGEATVTENIIANDLSTEPVTFKTQVRKHMYCERYALIDAFTSWHNASPVKPLAIDPEKRNIYFAIDDDNAAYFMYDYDAGLSMGAGACFSTGLYFTEDTEKYLLFLPSLAYSGLLNDSQDYKSYMGYINGNGEVVLDESVCYTDSKHMGYIQEPTNPVFRIKLPSAGVEDITTDASNSNEPVEYYNLQGQRVVDPQGGIFIRKQGMHVSKVAIK